MEKSNLSQELYKLHEICNKLDGFLQWAQSLVLSLERKNSRQKYIGMTTKGFIQVVISILIFETSHMTLAAICNYLLLLSILHFLYH